MFLSVFDVFKIGVGPSSSHTMGPMTAAADFLALLRRSDAAWAARSVRVRLHGSLAFTGKGHATDRAVTLGLLGHRPADLDVEAAERQLDDLAETRRLSPAGLPGLRFDPVQDVVFDYGPPLPGHANGLVFSAADREGDPVLSETYYSIGGGFVVTAAERDASAMTAAASAGTAAWPYPFATAAAMLRMARESGLSIANMKLANECDEPQARGGGRRHRAHLVDDGRLHRARPRARGGTARRPPRQAEGRSHPSPART